MDLLGALREPSVLADPYPFYAKLRRDSPILWGDDGQWYLTRHADIVAMLREARIGRFKPTSVPLSFRSLRAILRSFVSLVRARGRRAFSRKPILVLMQNMLLQDPPIHTRIRATVARPFGREAIERMRPQITATAERLLGRHPPGARFDLVSQFSKPFSIDVISDLLGIPEADRRDLERWSLVLTAALEAPRDLEGVDVGELVAAASHMIDHVRRLVTRPSTPLLETLREAMRAGTLSEDELVSICVLLLTAGHETTANLIGTATLALLRNPGDLARLRADPSLLPAAVEELGRYDSPVTRTGRLVALHEVTLGGRTFRPGTVMSGILASANRDPSVFPDPDRLDLGRRTTGHLVFGGGVHFCLGASLARLEVQVALATLLARYPTLEIDRLTWRPTTAIRGLDVLQLKTSKTS